MSLLLFVLALIAEARGFFVQDVVWLRTSRLGSTIPDQPFDLRSISSEDEKRNVAPSDPAFVHSQFDRYWSNTIYELHISRGRMQLQKVEDYLKPWIPWDRRPVQWDSATHSMGWRKLPAVSTGTGTTLFRGLNFTDRVVIHTPLRDFPLWPILAVTSILPSTRIVKKLRRPKPGFCPQCAYNLTGNTSGICPECGAKVSATSDEN